MRSNVQASKQQLLDDFAQVMSDAESLIKAVRDLPGEKAAEVRASAEKRLGAAKDRLKAMQGEAVEKATDAAKAADTYVRENPWPLIGGAVLLGFVLGLWARDPD